jgi:carbohydrate diacid regulator
MEKIVKDFINKIKQSTGIELSVFDESGNFIGGADSHKITVPNFSYGIFCDEQNAKTFFKLKYGALNLIAMMGGAGEMEKKFAYFICELADREFSSVSAISKTEFWRLLINGGQSAVQTEISAQKLGVPNAPSSVMLVKTLSGSVEDILDVLLNYGGTAHDFIVKVEDKKCALVKFAGASNNEYRSYAEFAEYLKSSVLEERGVKIKIYLGNGAENLYQIAESFAQALSTERMSDLIGLKGDVHSYKDYVLVRVLEQMPESRLKEYYAILTDKKSRQIFDDREMIETAEAFLENSLNVSETSRKMYLHRNTLNYRLDKIERGTGLNIRKFSDAVTFRLITVLSKIIKG